MSSLDILVDPGAPRNAGGRIVDANMENIVTGITLIMSERAYLVVIGKSLLNEPCFCGIYEPNDRKDLADKIIQLSKELRYEKRDEN